jgi:hypothetical protein
MDGIPWRCLNAYRCHREDRWWLSVHGIILCLDCQPPASPDLVKAMGDASDAPLVCPDNKRELADGRIDRPSDPNDAPTLNRPLWILRAGGMPEKVEAKGKRRKLEIPPDVTHWAYEGEPWTPYEPKHRGESPH